MYIFYYALFLTRTSLLDQEANGYSNSRRDTENGVFFIEKYAVLSRQGPDVTPQINNVGEIKFLLQALPKPVK
jgi:hypothetical protein